MLVGGYAVGIHGYPRATVDLDVWVHASPANAARVIAALVAFGLETTAPDAAVLLDPRTLIRVGLPPSRIEIMTSIDGVEFRACRRRAMMLDVDGVTVPVIGLDDLKTNKRASGRHKDLNDLENLP